MKLSLSQRGWEHLSWKQVKDIAAEMNFSGVELYNVQNYKELVSNDGPFSMYSAKTTMRRLREKHLELVCLDSSLDVASETDSVKSLIEIASALEVRFVAVRPLSEEGVEGAIESLISFAEARGVTILIKTSGAFADTKKLRDLLDTFANDCVAALWEIDHPFTEFEEDPAQTIENLGAYIKHVHVRDVDSDGEHCIVGEGTLPMEDIIRGKGWHHLHSGW